MRVFLLIIMLSVSSWMSYASQVIAPIAVGELIDKITILEIKTERLNDPDKKTNAASELAQLKEILMQTALIDTAQQQEFDELMEQLLAVNKKLWDIENAIRAKEAQKSFDEKFITLARSVYRNNQERSQIKRAINELTGSSIIEEKQYTEFE